MEKAADGDLCLAVDARLGCQEHEEAKEGVFATVRRGTPHFLSQQSRRPALRRS